MNTSDKGSVNHVDRAETLKVYLEKACNDLDTEGVSSFTNKVEISDCFIKVTFFFLKKYRHTCEVSLNHIALQLSGPVDNQTLALVTKWKARRVEEWTKDGVGYNDNIYFSCRADHPIQEVWSAFQELISICSSRRISSCFVATAAAGSPAHPAVESLRVFRNKVLSNHATGNSFMRWYYRQGPKYAAVIERHWLLRKIVFLGLILPVSLLARFILAQKKG